MKEYHKYKEELNIFTADLKDIIQHKWFTNTLIENWYDLNIIKTCKKHCGIYK